MEANSQLLRLILHRHAAMGLESQEALLLLHMADVGMEVRVRQGDLAARMGMSARQISRIVARLADRGMLQVTPTSRRDGGRAENIYDLTPFLVACGDR